MKEIREKAPKAIAQAWEGVETNAEAAERLHGMMMDDPQLYREIVAPFERQAARAAVQRNKIERRTRLWTRPSAPDRRVGLLARTNAITLLDMPLPSGLPLGDADKDAIKEALATYRDQIGYLSEKVRFLEALQAKLKRGKRVRECVTPSDLEAMKDEARNAS